MDEYLNVDEIISTFELIESVKVLFHSILEILETIDGATRPRGYLALKIDENYK